MKSRLKKLFLQFAALLALCACAALFAEDNAPVVPGLQSIQKTQKALATAKAHAADVDAVTAEATPVDAGLLFLQRYCAIGAALAADNLAAAKTAAAALPEAAGVAAAENLGAARKAFLALSAKAVAFAKGRAEYQIIFCSMYPPKGGAWAQLKGEIANPYFGASMLRCGTVQK